MTLLQAICHILQDAGTPLHYQEITERILTQGLWSAAGHTPAASVSAVLTTELKRQGEEAPFTRVGPGTYAWCAATLCAPTPVSSAVEPAPDPLSFNDAAALILEQHGQPLHYTALTEMALTQGLIQTKGQTPAATMNAQLTREIATATSRGELPRFVQHGQGMYGLSAWQPTGIGWDIEVHNAGIRQQLLAHLQMMDPTAFETLVGTVLLRIGFEDVVVTAKSGDGGVDVRGVLVACGGLLRLRYAVQVKRWNANVQAPDIQHLRGSLAAEEHGLFLTTSDYSAGAITEAVAPGKTPIQLITGRQFLGILIEYGVMVECVTMRVLDIHPAVMGQTGK
ncbi:MAG: Restriction endonuclease [bacterium ADurb.Bin429]|nr:MAG: Restriction endonuclease [bacterium ADurb.Bin429]